AAGRVRAADPRRDARRRDPLHAVGRDRGAVGARRRDRRPVAARPAVVPELPGRDVGAGRIRRSAPPRRSILAAPLSIIEADWTGTDVTIGSIERELARLRYETAEEGAQPNLRTSVMTHIAWAPPEWQVAAEETLSGMAERHPSRTLLLIPK